MIGDAKQAARDAAGGEPEAGEQANALAEVRGARRRREQVGAGYVVQGNAGGPANVSYPASHAAGRTGPIRNELVTAVKKLVGFSAKSFGDYKQESIGYGTRARYHGEEINEAEGERRLRQELTMHANRIDTAARRAGINLTQGQRDAMISFDFNTGKGVDLITSSGGNLNEIRRRMALCVKAGGKRLPDLVRRRREELEMFNS